MPVPRASGRRDDATLAIVVMASLYTGLWSSLGLTRRLTREQGH